MPAQFSFQTTPDGSITPLTRLIINHTGASIFRPDGTNATLTIADDLITADSTALLVATTPHGELYATNNSTETTVSANDTWYQFTETVVGNCHGTTCSATTDDIDMTYAGSYRVVASMSLTSPSGNQYIRMSVGVNGTTQDKCDIRRKVGTGGDVGAAAISCMLDLAAGDDIELYVLNESSTANILIEYLNLSVK